MRVLLKEVMWWHSDPTLGSSYNGCDTDPCMWCENAKRLLGEVGCGEEVDHAIAGPNENKISHRWRVRAWRREKRFESWKTWAYVGQGLAASHG